MLLIVLLAAGLRAQVYSPYVARRGQVDTRSIAALAAGIVERAGAHTPREKAEAIWRFFLTDGRFVEPGFWYHIAGWAYEEPLGEVLDPLKLVNSYGFGLCYQIAPLLAAVWDAAGFEDARVWFLTGHTVAEVYYDGGYHYFDSDMMGYTPAGEGDFRKLPVASVRQLEQDGGLILRKLRSPVEVKPGVVDFPWYPADVREAAMEGLAGLFTTTGDNRLFAFRRYPQGYGSDFVLRPGERLIRYFRPEAPRVYYLPYAWDGSAWREFPRPVKEYGIRTEDGPRSQKDSRLWGTGRIEYEPELEFDATGTALVEVASPYVIIDAAFQAQVSGEGIGIATSTDGGAHWLGTASLEPAVLARSEHGRLTAVSGRYAYLVRIQRRGAASVRDFRITTRFQLNPRTLPALAPGHNELVYESGPPLRRIPIAVRLPDQPRWFEEAGQGFVLPGALTFEVAAPGGAAISGFDAGGRFLDLRDGLAPDKLTAEVRKTAARLGEGKPSATLEWSLKREGPYRPLWSYDPEPRWRDGERISRLLRWPEVDKRVRDLPAGARRAYVRYRFAGMALDDVRLAVLAPVPRSASELEITHVWREGGRERRHVQIVRGDTSYAIDAGPDVVNEAVIFSCRRP